MTQRNEFVTLSLGEAPPPPPPTERLRLYADADGALRTVLHDGTDAAVGGGGSEPFGGGTITQPLTIDLPTGGAANGLVVKNDDQPVAFIRTDISGTGAAATTILDLQADGSGASKIALTDDTFDGEVVIGTKGSYFQPRSTVADASQTIEGVDKSGNDKFLFLADGSVIFGRNAVIPDTDLAAGQFGFWLDPTNGASKLMIKAKSTNGTVVTGEVALT
jgi:hypothetical protein